MWSGLHHSLLGFGLRSGWLAERMPVRGSAAILLTPSSRRPILGLVPRRVGSPRTVQRGHGRWLETLGCEQAKNE